MHFSSLTNWDSVKVASKDEKEDSNENDFSKICLVIVSHVKKKSTFKELST